MSDLRDAFRALTRYPLPAAVAVLSLGLGIGANAAIFSILDSLLLKSLPVRNPQSIIALAGERPGVDAAMGDAVWRRVRDRGVLSDPFVWSTDHLTATHRGESLALDGVWASGPFFDVLGVPAVLGRTFATADDQASGGPDGPVAVISYRLWQRVFGGAATTLGETLEIDRVRFTIVGVTPSDFFGLDVGHSVDVMLPLETEPLLRRLPARTGTWPWLHITARLRPGDTIDSATAAMRGIQPQIRRETMPDFLRADDRDSYLRAPWTMRSAATGSSSLRERYSTALFTLLAIVGTVLLVACANVANLQLARTAGRRSEFGVRAALGASPARIARQQLVECLLISAIGTVLGLLFAQWVGHLIVAQLSTWAATAFLDLTPDWRILGAIAVTMILTTVIFGTAPALRASRSDPLEALNRQRRGVVGGASMGLTDGIVVVQVGLSLLLIVGSSLFVRSFLMLVTRDLGFDRSRVLVAVIDGRRSNVGPEGRLALYERLRDAAAALPGVEQAALSMATPLGSAGVRFTPSVSIPGNRAATELRILVVPVSPGWFETFGTRLLAGRDFDARDRAGAGPVVIVNEAFAKRYLNGAPPIGQTILIGEGPSDLRPAEIVGLVRDAAFTSVRDPIQPTLYRSFAQTVDESLLARLPSISLSVRPAGGGPAASLTNALAASVQEIDSGLSMSFQTVNETLRPVLHSRPFAGHRVGLFRHARLAPGRGRTVRTHGALDPPSPHGDRHSHGDGRNRRPDRASRDGTCRNAGRAWNDARLARQCLDDASRRIAPRQHP